MDIYWDLQNHTLLSANNASQLITNLPLVLRDSVPITLRLCRPAASGDDAYTVEEPASGKSVILGVRALEALGDTPGVVLAEQDTWTFAGSAEASKADALLDLGDAAMETAIGTETELACIAEFSLRDATSSLDSDSTQFLITIKMDVNR